MVARQQHIGNGAALPFARAGIVRIFEQARFEAFLRARGLFADHAGVEADAGVKDRERGDLPAGQHITADRHLDQPARRNSPLVDSLEARAEDQQPPILSDNPCSNLLKPTSRPRSPDEINLNPLVGFALFGYQYPGPRLVSPGTEIPAVNERRQFSVEAVSVPLGVNNKLSRQQDVSRFRQWLDTRGNADDIRNLRVLYAIQIGT